MTSVGHPSWWGLTLMLAVVPSAYAVPDAPAEGEGRSTDRIVVHGRRLAEPARPDTTLRLTGRQLQERGVSNLSQALDLLLDTPIRGSGRRLAQVSIRGARRGGVLLLIDGTPVSDPFYGQFDVASIPVTDIAEIRVSLNPASPLDGPGGNGGVIEVLTRSALGHPLGRLQVQVGTSPTGLTALTGRMPVGGGVGLRISAMGTVDNRPQPTVLPSGEGVELANNNRQGAIGLRLERKSKRGRWSLDAAVSQREYLIPPGEFPGAGVSRVPAETTVRGVLGGDLHLGDAVVAARVYALHVDHEARTFEDADLAAIASEETINTYRTGGSLQVDVPLSAQVQLTGVTHLAVEGGRDVSVVRGANTRTEGSQPILEPALGATWLAWSWLTLEGAAGVAAPLGEGGAAPWPEAKITGTWTPTEVLQMRLVGARKGRLPSLRDRFSPTQGNPGIGPELGTSAEGSVVYEPTHAVTLEVSAYWRLTEDLIRTQATGSRVRVENAGDVTVRGVESKVEWAPKGWLRLGAGHAFAEAESAVLGDDPLDFFPRHRFEVFGSVRHQADGGLWARVRRTGDRLDGGKTLASYTTLDAAGWARLWTVQVGVRGENLLDATFDQRSGVPGYGRTLFLSLDAVTD